MTVPLPRERLAFLSEESWNKFVDWWPVARITRTIALHAITAATGMNQVEALIALEVLQTCKITKPYLAYYYRNHPKIIIGEYPLDKGLPQLPICGDECRGEILSHEDLYFDIVYQVRSQH